MRKWVKLRGKSLAYLTDKEIESALMVKEVKSEKSKSKSKKKEDKE